MITLLSLTAALSGCAAMDRLGAKKPDSSGSDIATEFAPAVSVQPLGNAGYAPAALDKTSAEEKAAALAAPAAGGEKTLGKAVVALGPPAETGLWVQTGYVKSAQQGRVSAPNGKSLAVELRPATGGALMSLSAYQALGIGLTELPELTIYAP